MANDKALLVQLEDSDGNKVYPKSSTEGFYDKTGTKVPLLMTYKVIGTEENVPQLDTGATHTHDASQITGVLGLEHGGLGGTTAAEGRTNLDVYSKSEINPLIGNKVDSDIQTCQVGSTAVSAGDVVDIVDGKVTMTVKSNAVAKTDYYPPWGYVDGNNYTNTVGSIKDLIKNVEGNVFIEATWVLNSSTSYRDFGIRLFSITDNVTTTLKTFTFPTTTTSSNGATFSINIIGNGLILVNGYSATYVLKYERNTLTLLSTNTEYSGWAKAFIDPNTNAGLLINHYLTIHQVHITDEGVLVLGDNIPNALSSVRNAICERVSDDYAIGIGISASGNTSDSTPLYMVAIRLSGTPQVLKTLQIGGSYEANAYPYDIIKLSDNYALITYASNNGAHVMRLTQYNPTTNTILMGQSITPTVDSSYYPNMIGSTIVTGSDVYWVGCNTNAKTINYCKYTLPVLPETLTSQIYPTAVVTRVVIVSGMSYDSDSYKKACRLVPFTTNSINAGYLLVTPNSSHQVNIVNGAIVGIREYNCTQAIAVDSGATGQNVRVCYSGTVNNFSGIPGTVIKSDGVIGFVTSTKTLTVSPYWAKNIDSPYVMCSYVGTGSGLASTTDLVVDVGFKPSFFIISSNESYMAANSSTGKKCSVFGTTIGTYTTTSVTDNGIKINAAQDLGGTAFNSWKFNTSGMVYTVIAYK